MCEAVRMPWEYRVVTTVGRFLLDPLHQGYYEFASVPNISLHCAGAANAGVPLAMIVQRYGWNAFFVTMVVSCAVVVLLMTPMANLKSYSQREAQGLIKAA